MAKKKDISNAAKKQLESIYSVDVASTIIEWANTIQEKCISLREKYYYDMNKGFDYNEAGIRTGKTMSELTADEETINSITDGFIKVQLTSHRHIIIYICVNGESIDETIDADNNELIYNLCPTNEYGVYGNENIIDDKNNNVYNKIASVIVNIFNKLNNNIVKEIMKKTTSKDATSIESMAQKVQELAIAAVENVCNGADLDKESKTFSKKVAKLSADFKGMSLHIQEYNGGKSQCIVDMKHVDAIANTMGKKWNGKIKAENVASKIRDTWGKNESTKTANTSASPIKQSSSVSNNISMVVNNIIKSLRDPSSLISLFMSKSSETFSSLIAEQTEGVIRKCEFNGDNLVVYSEHGVSESFCIKSSNEDSVCTCVNHLMFEDKKKMLIEGINSTSSSTDLEEYLKKVA